MDTKLPTCGDCRFAVHLPDNPTVLECHLNPPRWRDGRAAMDNDWNHWLIMAARDWCGKWEGDLGTPRQDYDHDEGYEDQGAKPIPLRSVS